MKKHVIAVSSHDLTRCVHCSRHQQIDRNLSSAELLALKCHFCHEPLINNAGSHVTRPNRSSKLAIGLLSASLSLTACESSSEEPMSGGEQIQAGDMAGVEMVPAGDYMSQPEYGAPPPAGMEAGDMAGVEMVPAGDYMSQPEYGAPPPAGMEAGEMAGSEAGSSAGNEAGSSAGNEAGVEMVPAGDDMSQPEYGAPPPAGNDD